MKKIYSLVAAIALSVNVFAQAPEKMSYQAVIRDAGNTLVTSQVVGVKISILQGSVSGTAVYVETQTPTTNINGLVSIEIGAGAVVSGAFTSIDWRVGPHFIKTETDPAGGTSYTITGTSQLISVPYALHANTADTITGTVSESQITGLNYTVDTKADSTEIANMGYFAGPHNRKYEVGDTALGGVVFWIDESGQHGLVVSPSQLSSGNAWWTGNSTYTLGRGEGLFDGEMNTILALVTYGDNPSTYPTSAVYPARACAELTENQNGVTYGGWYLPSKEELNQLWLNRSIVNPKISSLGGQQISTGFHWSSTETSSGLVWGQNMSSGLQSEKSKASTYSVRAIRKF